MFWHPRAQDLTGIVDVTTLVQGLPDFSGAARAKAGFLTVFNDWQLSELSLTHVTNGNTGTLVLVLQCSGERPIRLIRHDRQLCGTGVLDALTILVNRQAQTAPDRLTAFCLAGHVAQGADLEHVRVIPTFT